MPNIMIRYGFLPPMSASFRQDFAKNRPKTYLDGLCILGLNRIVAYIWRYQGHPPFLQEDPPEAMYLSGNPPIRVMRSGVQSTFGAAQLVADNTRFLTISHSRNTIRYLPSVIALLFAISFVAAADADEPPEIRTIGLLVPDTGNVPAILSSQVHGAVDFALSEFNRHLDRMDADWRLDIVKRDTKSDPTETLAAVRELDAMGIKAFLGPATSSNLREIQDYVAANQMVSVSYASGAADLAIPGDSIFRTIPDATTYAHAMHALLRHDGIREVVIVFLDDTIGRSVNHTLYEAVDADAQDGIAIRDTIKFHPTTGDPLTVADGIISALADDDAGVGVVVFDFTGKIIEVVRHVAGLPASGIDATKWYGPDHLIDELHADDTTRPFLMGMDYQVLTLAYSENDINLRLDSLVDDAGIYAYAAYDALLIMGNAIDAAGSAANGDAIAEMIPEVARTGHGPAFHEPIWDPLVCGSGGLFRYAGALGTSIELNEAGDLARADYTISTISDDGFKTTHRYDSATDSIREFTFPEEVKVDVMVPDGDYITGDAGAAVEDAISLAEYCYNLGLARDGAEWRLDLYMYQNTSGSHPVDVHEAGVADAPSPYAETHFANDVYKMAAPGVVDILLYDGSGTGFVFDDRGHIVTNAHVLGNATEVEVQYPDGQTYVGAVVGIDRHTDLAVISVDADPVHRNPIPIGDSDALEVGDWVAAIGSPFGFSGSMTAGIVSQTDRLYWGLSGYAVPDTVQTDAAVNSGNSGGPLLNMYGEVIGVNVSGVGSTEVGDNTGVNFAVSSAILLDIVPVLISEGAYKHPWMGVSGNDQHGNGFLIEKVVDGGPADMGGLVAGDVVVSVDGHDVSSIYDILLYLQRAKSVGDELDVVVLTGLDYGQVEGGMVKEATLVLGERPDDYYPYAETEPAFSG